MSPGRPPTNRELIACDNTPELLRRVCAQGDWVLRRVDRGEAFWTGAWARMVRQSLHHGSLACASMLALLVDARDDQRRPLPEDSLGWLLRGLEERGGAPLALGMARPEVLECLGWSRIRLGREDGLRLLRLGGPAWVLGFTVAAGANGEDCPFDATQAFRTAWHRWCAQEEHQQAAIAWLAQDPSPERPAAQPGLLEELVDGMDAACREGVLARFCHDVGQGQTCQRLDMGAMAWVGDWLKAFSRNGWPLDQPLWPAWFGHLAQGLCQVPPAPIANAWVEMVLHAYAPPDPHCPPPGLAWSPELAQALARARAPTGLAIVEEWETPSRMGSGAEERAQHLARWLGEAVDLEGRLMAWGLMDAAGQKHWRAAIGAAMGGNWEERIQALMGRGLRADNPLQEAWRQWRARNLELRLAAGRATSVAARL